MAVIKQEFVRLLRAARIIDIAERLSFWRMAVSWRRNNKAFLADNPGFVAPPLWLLYETTGHASYRMYHRTGAMTAKLIFSLLRRHMGKGKMRCLEWGCGPGRVIGKLANNESIELCGSDYNPQSITWLKSAYPQIRFEKNEIDPPLRFESNSFDMVYALSVFTHLSEEGHMAWIAEIERILKPGGIFIASFHGEESLRYLQDFEKERFLQGELVVRGEVKEGSRLYCAYHPHSYLENVLFKRFEVLEVIKEPGQFMLQSLWVIRKPAL